MLMRSPLSSQTAFQNALRKPKSFLTRANGLTNGSEICKYLKTPKVYGLTGKTPPGGPIRPVRLSPSQSNLVRPGPTWSNLVQPGPTWSNLVHLGTSPPQVH
jgi:hypothetical protein